MLWELLSVGTSYDPIVPPSPSTGSRLNMATGSSTRFFVTGEAESCPIYNMVQVTHVTCTSVYSMHATVSICFLKT